MFKRLSSGVLMLMLAAPGQADIYRCDIEGVVVFADAPCQADAVPYEIRGDISVIEAPSNLDEIEAANQALIQHRLDQQAERAAAARRQAQAVPARPVQRELYPVVPIFGPFGYHYPDRRRSSQARQEPEAEIQREQRYSALSGRLPGTRRRDDEN